MSVKRPWYDSYDELRGDVEVLRKAFGKRCKQLNQSPVKILHAFSRDIVARIVFESNWQEGIEVDRGRTKELADIVFEDLDPLDSPHIDFASILNNHKKHVVGLRRKRVPDDEVAAYNLSAAHRSLWWIAEEMLEREAASLAIQLKTFEKRFATAEKAISEDERSTLAQAIELVKKRSEDSTTRSTPFTGAFKTTGALFKKYLDCNLDTLLHPLRLTHLHFLHQILLMGIYPTSKCGQFRKKGVHVSNPEVFFPPAEAVPAMMTEFCQDFPPLHGTLPSDHIMAAATFSFRLVRIHPYSDGNGRLSRLVMNLVLLPHDPPVYIKADKKGRHRYSQALRRADRGNLRPLASLIALSLKEVYAKLLASLERDTSSGNSKRSDASKIASKN